MSITFNSAGGFFNGTISSSNGDVFITTSGSAGSITIGNQVLTGSQVIEKDAEGNERNKKTFNPDGTITQEKFDQNGKIVETKVKDPSLGKEFIRSGSSTSNQIEFRQDSVSAEITLSGSGVNRITYFGTGDSTSHPGFFQRQDTAKGTVYTTNLLSGPLLSTGMNAAGDYFITPTSVAPINSTSFESLPPAFKLTNAGDITMSGDLTVAGTLTAQEFHTEFTSASIVLTSGSTIFGNSHDDTHTFTGTFVNAITASGDISSSGTGTFGDLSLPDDGVLNVGTGNDLQIKHNGSNSFITDTGTGDLYIRAADNLRIQATSTNEDMIKAIKDGGVELYHNNVKKLETTADGVIVTGDISGSSTSTGSFGSVHTTGKIGIGLASPLTPLHIKSAGESTGGIRFQNTHDIVNMFFVGDDNDEGFQITYVGTGGAEIELQADGDLLLNASNGDNVGIGTTSPGEKLEVVGNISASGVGDFGSLDIAGNIDVDGLANLDIVDIDGAATFQSRTVFEIGTFTDGDATPDVRARTIFKTANTGATTITGFDNGTEGQIIHVALQDNNTDFTNGTNLILFRGLNYTSGQTNDILSFLCLDGTKWLMLNAQDNS